jgi:hypothetical protein
MASVLNNSRNHRKRIAVIWTVYNGKVVEIAGKKEDSI